MTTYLLGKTFIFETSNHNIVISGHTIDFNLVMKILHRRFLKEQISKLDLTTFVQQFNSLYVFKNS